MQAREGHFTGGCLCGALTYDADGPPQAAGYCCCVDSRRATGSGFVPFMVLPAAALRVRGEARQISTPAHRGGEAVRNFCAGCGGLVFGGRLGVDDSHTLYAGSLDDPGLFVPTLAIFVRDRAPWVLLPDGLRTFETMPD
jgi:hypothetical protein